MTETDSVAVLTTKAKQMLGDTGSRLDVELLLGHCLGLTRTALLARSDQRLSPTQLTLFKAMLEQRKPPQVVPPKKGTKRKPSKKEKYNALRDAKLC